MAPLYHINPHTGKYLPGMNTDAPENPKYSPETHDIRDRYIYNEVISSLIPPPDIGENECAVLENGAWVIKVDLVGRHYYQQDGTRIDITEIGVDIPEGCIRTDPPSAYHTTHNGAAWIEDRTKKKAALKQAYWLEYLDYLNAGFSFDGIIYQCRPDDINDWMMLKNYVETLPMETVIQIRASDNRMISTSVNHYLTLFAPALGQHVHSARMAYWAKVDAL